MSYAKLTITDTPGIENSVTVTVEAEPPIACDAAGDPLVEKLSHVQAAAIYAVQMLAEVIASADYRTFFLGDTEPWDER